MPAAPKWTVFSRPESASLMMLSRLPRQLAVHPRNAIRFLLAERPVEGAEERGGGLGLVGVEGDALNCGELRADPLHCQPGDTVSGWTSAVSRGRECRARIKEF